MQNPKWYLWRKNVPILAFQPEHPHAVRAKSVTPMQDDKHPCHCHTQGGEVVTPHNGLHTIDDGFVWKGHLF